MIKLKVLRTYLDRILPSNGIVDNGINGLQVEGSDEVLSIATAVSASLSTLEGAVDAGVNALIVHHGIFWKGGSPVIEGTLQKKMKLLLENKISLFAYHLPLDLNPLIGNNWRAAREMGWSDLEPFGLYQGSFIGVKWKVTPQSKEDFKKILETYYGHSATCAWGGPDVVQRVALISGGAHKSIFEAAQDRLDAFITGSFDEPVWHQAQEEKINFYY